MLNTIIGAFITGTSANVGVSPTGGLQTIHGAMYYKSGPTMIINSTFINFLTNSTHPGGALGERHG